MGKRHPVELQLVQLRAAESLLRVSVGVGAWPGSSGTWRPHPSSHCLHWRTPGSPGCWPPFCDETEFEKRSACCSNSCVTIVDSEKGWVSVPSPLLSPPHLQPSYCSKPKAINLICPLDPQEPTSSPRGPRWTHYFPLWFVLKSCHIIRL